MIKIKLRGKTEKAARRVERKFKKTQRQEVKRASRVARLESRKMLEEFPTKAESKVVNASNRQKRLEAIRKKRVVKEESIRMQQKPKQQKRAVFKSYEDAQKNFVEFCKCGEQLSFHGYGLSHPAPREEMVSASCVSKKCSLYLKERQFKGDQLQKLEAEVAQLPDPMVAWKKRTAIVYQFTQTASARS